MFFRHHTDKLVVPIIVALLVFATSYRGKYHLRSEMPTVFFENDGKPDKLSLERKIAWAYWESALLNIQWRYPYSHPLPIDPPAEFQIDAKALGPNATDPATRLLYWHRLQRIWYLPETWEKDYGWDFSWVNHPIDAGGNWLKDMSEHLFNTHF